jgi:hypothetical protein
MAGPVLLRSSTSNGLDRYGVLNRARVVIDAARGRHRELVLTRDGKPVTRFYDTGWRAARRRAALRYEGEVGRPCLPGLRSIHVHDMKHVFGCRLRMAGSVSTTASSSEPPVASRHDALLTPGIGVLIEAAKKSPRARLEGRSVDR